jgi:hypothetical protein
MNIYFGDVYTRCISFSLYKGSFFTNVFLDFPHFFQMQFRTAALHRSQEIHPTFYQFQTISIASQIKRINGTFRFCLFIQAHCLYSVHTNIYIYNPHIKVLRFPDF